jgi:hypothetical protein
MWHHLASVQLYEDVGVKILCDTHENLRVLSEMLLSLDCSDVTINFTMFTLTATLPTMYYLSRNKINRVWHQVGRDQDWYMALLEKSQATATSNI